MTTISNKFASLPYGIIRDIISYTGMTYKIRNGKFMSQIPKDDPRYDILNKLPNRFTAYFPYSARLKWTSASTYIELIQNDCYITYTVSIITFPNEGREIIGYYHKFEDNTGKCRRYAYEIEDYTDRKDKWADQRQDSYKK